VVVWWWWWWCVHGGVAGSITVSTRYVAAHCFSGREVMQGVSSSHTGEQREREPPKLCRYVRTSCLPRALLHRIPSDDDHTIDVSLRGCLDAPTTLPPDELLMVDAINHLEITHSTVGMLLCRGVRARTSLDETTLAGTRSREYLRNSIRLPSIVAELRKPWCRRRIRSSQRRCKHSTDQ
jgi:hypothetical protein